MPARPWVEFRQLSPWQCNLPPHGGSRGGYHFAFSIASDDVEAWQGRLESEGVAVESVVTWPRGAKSLYFRDPDRNLAELITPGFWSILLRGACLAWREGFSRCP